MTKETSLDEVEATVEAVRVMQGQIRTILVALKRLVDRVEALETAGSRKRADG